MKIALIQCPVWGTYDPPMALARLSACLKKDGQEVSCFDLNIRLYINRLSVYKDMWAWDQSLFWYNENNVERFFKTNNELIKKYVAEFIDSKARIIGFSVSDASKLASLKIAEMIKGFDKEIIIIFGGPLFFKNRFVEDILKEDAVDIVISGEGEAVLPELVRFIKAKKDISDCTGIFFKQKGKIVYTGPRAPLSNLDDLPFLDFSDLPLSRYDDSKHLPFLASRGCIQRCVFCSSRAFWPGFRAMGGRRVFEEIKFYKKPQGVNNPNFGHIDFLDLMFNGNMKYLVEFCDLMIKENLDLKWSANMIVRPEMTSDVINKMKDSGCKHVIFGIESGSQRVLDLMRKNYRITDADRIIRDMHKAGIIVTGNFMFGFPGETEDDFQETLGFIKRNAVFFDRVYPSRTYCAIEEFSYLAEHLEEFGIKPNPPNHLFWESVDGANTYPVRLERCRKFSQVASFFGVEVGGGVQTSVDLDELFNLYLYYEYKQDFKHALDHLLKYFDYERLNAHVRDKLKFFLQKFNEKDPLFDFEDSRLSKLKEVVLLIEAKEKAEIKEVVNEFMVKENTKEDNFYVSPLANSKQNDREFGGGKLILESFPKLFFFEINGPCNSHCAFCPRSQNYELFNMRNYRTRFEDKLSIYLSKAEKITFSGWGELLLLPDAKEILEYFDENYPHAIKEFYTNGTSLSPEICDKIVNSKSKFNINVSLHVSSHKLHAVLTQTDNFYKILEQVKYLLKIREPGKQIIRFVFTATTLNIDDLPNFVKFAADFGVDKIICYYNYIYTPVQKYLSCFFRQETANTAIGVARGMAYRLNMKIDLPPRFGINENSTLNICPVPWSQIMFDTMGEASVCEVLGRSGDSLEGKRFMDIWNGAYYQNLRKSFVEGNAACFKHCIGTNPSCVNEFNSHVINRNTEKQEVFL
jgi:radical SAM superfamily enzyme YgiQ (UPF0313 family)/MoaA/NifB/PqqE/SkfB family radical SAM enzyme